jgi:hypothetical protein
MEMSLHLRLVRWVYLLLAGVFLAMGSSKIEAQETISVEVPEPVSSPDGESQASIVEFLKLLDKHQSELQPVWNEHAPAMIQAALPVLARSVSLLMIPQGILWGLAFLLSIHLVSMLLAPSACSIRNAAIFAGVQVLLVVAGSLISMLLSASLALWVVVWAIVGIGMFVSQIVLTMNLYQVGIGRMLLFGILGNILFSVMMTALTFLSSLLVTPEMVAQAIPVGEVAHASLLPVVNAEIAAIQPQFEEYRNQIESNRQKLADLEARKGRTQEQLSAAEKEIADLSKDPAVVYPSIGKLVDQGKLDEAKKAYEELARDHPHSEYAGFATHQANVIAEMFQRSAEEQRQAKAEAERLAAESEAAFKARVKSGAATLSEVRRFLIGKSKDDVIFLLGQPSSQPTNALMYVDFAVRDPVNTRSGPLVVYLFEERVQGVNIGRK